MKTPDVLTVLTALVLSVTGCLMASPLTLWLGGLVMGLTLGVAIGEKYATKS